MNKYIEAFDTIECRCHTDYEVCNCNKATKDKMCQECDVDKDLQVLHELVEKATPKKPKGYYASVPHYRCPNCNCEVQLYSDSTKYPYCHYCGQNLDWSKEYE